MSTCTFPLRVIFQMSTFPLNAHSKDGSQDERVVLSVSSVAVSPPHSTLDLSLSLLRFNILRLNIDAPTLLFTAFKFNTNFLPIVYFTLAACMYFYVRSLVLC